MLAPSLTTQHGSGTSQLETVNKVPLFVAPHLGAGRTDHDRTTVLDDVLDHVLDRWVKRVKTGAVGSAFAHPIHTGTNQEHRDLESRSDTAVGHAPGNRGTFIVKSARDNHNQFLRLRHGALLFGASSNDFVPVARAINLWLEEHDVLMG